MPESQTQPTDEQRPDTAHSGNRSSDTDYADAAGRRAPWYKRLQKRRITPRKIALYLAVVAIVVLSEPILPTFVMGSILVLAGIALRIWTFGHLEKNHRFITTGPYAHSRNPAYLGSFVIFCGVVLAAGNPYTIAGWTVWGLGVALIVAFFIHYMPRKYAREYGRLEKEFPDEFATHAAHVPHFFPRLTPWRSGDTKTFSWTRVHANHELWWSSTLSMGQALILAL